MTTVPKQPRPLPARLDYGHFGIRLIPTQAKASTPGHPTGRADPPAGGVPRKLAGRRPGAAIRHPSGTLLCLHVSKPGSDGLELTPLLPLDATRSSPCRRLGYIVTNGPAKTAHNQWIPTTTAVNNRAQPRLQTARATGPRSHRPNRAAARQALCGRGQPRTSCLGQSTFSAPVLRLQAEHRALSRPTSSTKPEPTRPAINLAKSGQSPYPLFVTARFNSSTTQRRFHHDTHSSLLVSAGPAAFSGLLQFLNPSTRFSRFTHSPPISPMVSSLHTSLSFPFSFHRAPSHRPAIRTARSLGSRLHRFAHSDA